MDRSLGLHFDGCFRHLLQTSINQQERISGVAYRIQYVELKGFEVMRLQNRLTSGRSLPHTTLWCQEFNKFGCRLNTVHNIGDLRRPP